jgi:hypothetical protein
VIILRVLQERQQSGWTAVAAVVHENGARLKAETRTGDRSPMAYDSGRRRKSGGWRRWRQQKR